jgi:hypothetical protein
MRLVQPAKTVLLRDSRAHLILGFVRDPARWLATINIGTAAFAASDMKELVFSRLPRTHY